MPKNYDENQIYADILTQSGNDHAWLDITEEDNGDSATRAWRFRDGTPVTWTIWNSGEPNNENENERNVEILANGRWNDYDGSKYKRLTICSYFLPKEAETKCPWLLETLLPFNDEY